jgi:hypothetical protein
MYEQKSSLYGIFGKSIVYQLISQIIFIFHSSPEVGTGAAEEQPESNTVLPMQINRLFGFP